MFRSEKYLTHLEIMRKGENFAIGDLKGGLKLGDIHEETKATNRYFKSRAIILEWEVSHLPGTRIYAKEIILRVWI